MSTDLASDFDYCVDPDDYDEEGEQVLEEDVFKDDVAWKLAVVGLGQCGGNLAAQFHEAGYRRILLINTAKTDLDSITQPVAKLAITGAKLGFKKNGAGQDRDAARECAEENETLIRTRFASVFRGKIDKIVLCMSLGGGTGSGAGPKVIEIAKEFIKEKGGDPAKDVIVFRVLPKPSLDGPHMCHNAMKAYGEIDRLNVVRIDIDNEKVGKGFKKCSFEEHQDRMNHWIVRTFHRFNNYAARESRFGNCDGNDLDNVFSRGRVIFSAFAVKDLDDRYTVGETLARYLSKSVFAVTNLKTASVGACIMILNRARIADKSHEDFSNAFEVMNGIMRPDSTLHRGTFVEDFPPKPNGEEADTIFCYAALGGMEPPLGTLVPIFECARKYAPQYGTPGAYLND